MDERRFIGTRDGDIDVRFILICTQGNLSAGACRVELNFADPTTKSIHALQYVYKHYSYGQLENMFVIYISCPITFLTLEQFLTWTSAPLGWAAATEQRPTRTTAATVENVKRFFKSYVYFRADIHMTGNFKKSI